MDIEGREAHEAFDTLCGYGICGGIGAAAEDARGCSGRNGRGWKGWEYRKPVDFEHDRRCTVLTKWLIVGLPKALREALEYLASEKQVADIISLLEAALEEVHDVEEGEMPFIDLAKGPAIHWKEGVEEYQKVAEDNLWRRLGLHKQKLPFFNTLQDRDGVRDPWDEKNREYFAQPDNCLSLAPLWHQVVGVLGIVERVFKGNPVLLMDEVGLGKTMQMVGVICVLAYFREYYEKHGRFPGSFGM
jgi:hypothetical protein